MEVYFGFDDTDHYGSPYGTGKLVRWFLPKLSEGCRFLGVVRQQLLVCDGIPYTSHNSSACLIADVPDASLVEPMIADAVGHIIGHAVPGSDPGLCVATEMDAALDGIVEFGRRCTHRLTTQAQALRAAGTAHLSGHGGTNDGIIGATAAVGLTVAGWSGRYIELAHLRDWPVATTVAELSAAGIATMSVDRDAQMPAPPDTVHTNGWLRPRLIGHRPVLLVRPQDGPVWVNIDRKRQKRDHQVPADPSPATESRISSAG